MMLLLIKWASQPIILTTNLMLSKITMRLLLLISIGLLGVLQETDADGKPWCKGRNYPGGKECCESEDPEGSKCTEGQGDCDSDAGCAGTWCVARTTAGSIIVEPHIETTAVPDLRDQVCSNKTARY